MQFKKKKKKKVANADLRFCIIVILNTASALGRILLSSISLCISPLNICISQTS